MLNQLTGSHEGLYSQLHKPDPTKLRKVN